MNNDSSKQSVLQTTFGFSDFRPGQEKVINALLNGDSALAVFPTGGGKSLCYQLPALMMEGVTLVVSPLIALMKDQIDFLKSRNIEAERLDSSLTASEARRVWSSIDKGTLKLLYVSPERFNSERFIQRMSRTLISMLVIDEAHCISEWGHNFRPDYLKLAKAGKELNVQRVLALTATATPAVAQDVMRTFQIKPENYVNTGFHRPNLTLFATPCRSSQRMSLLIDRLRERSQGPTIVYVTLQKTAEEVAAALRENGFEACYYHAGMNAEERHEVQDWFMKCGNGIVAATIAFGMGIDKSDIRYVYHYNLPKALENYSQEIGRAGRDGNPSVCELFACEGDVVTLENFSYGDTPIPESVGGFVKHIFSRGDVFDVSTYELSKQFDIRSVVVSTLLCYLELEGAIHATGPFYNLYKYKFLIPEQQVFAVFNQQRADFLRAVFNNSKMGRIWYSADLEQISGAIGQPRDRLVRAFNYLEEQGMLELQVSGLRLGYRKVKDPESLDELSDQLSDRFLGSEKRDIDRIEQVLAAAVSKECLTNTMLSYFGETIGACGHCDRCAGVTIPEMPAEPVKTIPTEVLRSVEDLAKTWPQVLGSPRQLARFLCGLTSPGLYTMRPPLTKHEHFGVFADQRFGKIMEAVCDEN